MKWFVALTVSVAIAPAASAQICGSLTVTKTETGNVIPWPWDIPTAHLERCDAYGLEIAGFSVPLTDFDSNNSLTGQISWNMAGAANIAAGLSLSNSIVTSWKNPLNWANLSCTQRNVETLAHMGGQVSQYAFHIGGGGPRGRDTKGVLCGAYPLSVFSPFPATLEIPVHISGSVSAAESFGNPGTTEGKAMLTLSGNVNGVGFGPQTVSVTSTTVIPDQASINWSILVPVAVGAGATSVNVQWNGQVEVTTRAQAGGLFGLLSGSATAIADFPNSIRIGALRSAGGGALPPCVAVSDTLTGAQFAWNNGTTYCTAKPNSLGCAPAMESSGSPSMSAASGFVVSARNVRNQKAGQLFYSTAGRASTPFLGGTLCVAGPLRRAIATTSGGAAAGVDDCSGVLSIDMNAFARGALGGAPAPELSSYGARVWCQWWSRDPGASFNTSLSDALEYAICQ